MKKFLALLLAVLMIASMSVTAFAEEVTNEVSGSKTGNVDVQVFDKSTNKPIESTGTYKVTITWGNLLFKIEVANANDVTWNGSAYTVKNGAWDHEEADVTVTNLSDMPIKVNGLFDNGLEESATVDGVTAKISGGVQNLASAVGQNPAPVATYTVEISETVPTTLKELEFTVDIIELTIQTA